MVLTPPPKTSRLMQFITLYFVFLIVAGLQALVFNPEIGTAVVQSDFLIDAYYYIELGQRIATEYWAGTASIYDVVLNHRPNISSTGITYVNAVYAILGISGFGASALQCALLSVTICSVFGRRAFFAGGILLMFSGLLVYLLLPSKESFILIGFLIFIGCQGWQAKLVALSIIALARPEAAVLMIAGMAAHSSWYKFGRIVTILILIGIYVTVRSEVIASAQFIEELSATYDNFFCSVGPLSVCLSDGQVFEFVALKRLLLTAGLPVKWLWDIAWTFNGESLTELITKGSLVMAAIGMVRYRKAIVQTWRNSREMRRTVWVVVVYMSSFSAIVFYQPSRQFALAWSLLLMASLVYRNSDKQTSSVCIRGNDFDWKAPSRVQQNERTV
jgi:hypothetical protein